MFEFLTLGISEKRPGNNEFSVIAMDLRNKTFTKFDLDKSDIISDTGEVFWDIGFTTYVNDITHPNKYTQLAAGVNPGSYRIKDLKSILEAKSANPRDFFENTNLDYSVVKVAGVEDMTLKMGNDGYGKDVLKSYMKVNISGISAYENSKVILNKDYRWLKYWNYVYESNKFNEKKIQYMHFLNCKKKNIYLILYRHKFKNNCNHWIVGMHRL